MGKQLLQLTKKSIKRRWREIWRGCMATFLAIFFITGVLLFQENMYQWQVASNKERYGDWFIMETNTTKPNPLIAQHPLMEGYSVAESALKLYNSDWELINRYVGYMSPEFIKQSYIDVEKGRMPKADDEIAMDWDTLLRMGITAELGQTVTIYYYESNDENHSKNRRSEEFKLVGVLESYTDTWKKGKNLPGVIVTKARYDAYDNNAQNMFIHKIKDNIKTDDYSLLYEGIKEESGSNSPIYNDYLYEYEPWGSDSVYNYMYMVVMVIGVAAIIYQLIIYNNRRRTAYRIMRDIGAEQSQITIVSFIENAFILVVPGLMGIIATAVFGKLVCVFIEIPMGIPFYYVKWTVLLKGFLTIVLAAVIQFGLDKLIYLKDVISPAKYEKKPDKRIKHNNITKSRKTISSKNLTSQISFRFTSSNSRLQNMAIRLLSLGVCVVMVFCALNIGKAYVQYSENSSKPDFVGYYDGGQGYNQSVYAYIPFDIKQGQTLNEAYNELTKKYGEDGVARDQFLRENIDIPHAEARQQIIKSDGDVYLRELAEGKGAFINGIGFGAGLKYKYLKPASTSIDTELTEKIIDTINNTAGVKDVTYSNYESRRVWSWDGMSPDGIAWDKLQITGETQLEKYCNKYLFATQYQEPTEELYAKLSKYIDKDMIDYEAFVKGQQIVVFVDENPDERFDESIKPGININYHYYPVFSKREYSTRLREVYGDITYKELYEMELYRREMYEACITPKVAAVVKVTDQVEKEFKDLIVGFGYYTAIASFNLGQSACDNQNAFVEECLKQKLSEEQKLKMNYNQMTITYDLSSSFSATDNIIENFCKENNIAYNKLAEDKELYRTELINAILTYGITLMAMLVINVLIVAIIAKSRLEARKERFMLLGGLGAEQSRIMNICMIEAVRESLWCVFTMPLVLLVQYAICIKATDETDEKKAYKRLVTGITITGVVIITIVIAAIIVMGMDAANSEKESESQEQTETATTVIRNGNILVKYEVNGEKLYREESDNLKIVYRRFDKKILSKEEIKSFSFDKGGYSTNGNGKVYHHLDLYNIYEGEPISKIKFTMYNGSAFLVQLGQEADVAYKETEHDFTEPFVLDYSTVNSNRLVTLYMLYEYKGGAVEMNETAAAIVDKVIMQADITYNDGSVKTEYLSLGSYQGRNCAAITMYRLDEIKAEFKDLLVDYGYYTAIASVRMAETACENQNKLMADILEERELPTEAKCEPVYNQIAIYYDLSSSYSATANIVKVYFKEADVRYISNTEQKETLRTKTISAMLQYGVTMLAAMLINVLIIAIVIRNRIVARRQKLRTLVRLGLDKARLCRICMIEGVREAVWCIFTMPFVMVVEYVIYRKAIRELEFQNSGYDILQPPKIVTGLRKTWHKLSLISAETYASVGVVVIILLIVLITPMASAKHMKIKEENIDTDYVIEETEVESENNTIAEVETETRKVVVMPPPSWVKTYNEKTKLWVITVEKFELEAGVTYVSKGSNYDPIVYSWGTWDETLNQAIVENKGGTKENISKYSYMVEIDMYKGFSIAKARDIEAEYKRLKAQTDLNIHIGYKENSQQKYYLFGELTLAELREFPANSEYTYNIRIIQEGHDKNYDKTDVTGLVKYEEQEDI